MASPSPSEEKNFLPMFPAPRSEPDSTLRVPSPILESKGTYSPVPLELSGMVRSRSSSSEESRGSPNPLVINAANLKVAVELFGEEKVMKYVLSGKIGKLSYSGTPLKDPSPKKEIPRRESSFSLKQDPPREVALPTAPKVVMAPIPIYEPMENSAKEHFEEEFAKVAEDAFAAGVRSAKAQAAAKTPLSLTREELLELNTRFYTLGKSARDSEETVFKPERNKSNRKKAEVDSSEAAASDEYQEDPGDEVSTDEELAKKTNRRISALLPPREKRSAERTVLKMHTDQPKFEHIRLKTLDLDDIFCFWSEIEKYNQKYNILLPAASMVEDEVRLRIMSRNYIMDSGLFFKLPNRSLAKLIQKTVRPVSKNLFAEILAKSVKWSNNPNGRRLSVLSYQDYYDRLLTLRREFQEKFDFLASGNSEHIPKCVKDSTGLIGIFLNACPGMYAKNVFADLEFQKYASLEKFFDAFYAKLKEHHEYSLSSQKLNSFIPYDPCIRSSTASAKGSAEQKKPFFRRSLNNLANNLVSPEGEDGYELDDPEDSYPAYLVQDDDPGASDVEDATDSMLKPSESTALDTGQLNAFGGGTFKSPHRPPPKPASAAPTSILRKPSDTAPKGPNGCFRAMTEGKCTKPGCMFDHSIAVLDATREDLMNRMAKRAYAARGLNAVHTPDSALDPPAGGRA